MVEVLRWITEASRSGDGVLEGVTFSGGEPFDQAPALAELACEVQALGLGVMIFTGHPGNDLEASTDPGWQALMANSDLLVAGPYVWEEPGTHPLLSSANQRLVFLTPRYRNLENQPASRRVELRISAAGVTRMTGFPSSGFRNQSFA